MFDYLKNHTANKGASRFLIVIGFAQILIGGITLIGNLATLALNTNPKTPNVLLFVILTGLISLILGIELLRLNKLAYQALLYFASVIFLSKILMLMGIVNLTGELETSLPSDFKGVVSLLYHGFLIYYLSTHHVRNIFK